MQQLSKSRYEHKIEFSMGDASAFNNAFQTKLDILSMDGWEVVGFSVFPDKLVGSRFAALLRREIVL